jgi:hypothetical protein
VEIHDFNVNTREPSFRRAHAFFERIFEGDNCEQQAASLLLATMGKLNISSVKRLD